MGTRTDVYLRRRINSTGQVVRPFAGGIDEAAVYTVQLSAGRIAAHYQDGAVALSGIGQWTSLSPATVPAGRYDAASAFDASATDGTHGKLVVFGGENSSSVAVQETWTWDGTNRTKLTPATSPSARWGARMAYDTATGLTDLFGGYTGTTYLNDTACPKREARANSRWCGRAGLACCSGDRGGGSAGRPVDKGKQVIGPRGAVPLPRGLTHASTLQLVVSERRPDPLAPYSWPLWRSQSIYFGREVLPS